MARHPQLWIRAALALSCHSEFGGLNWNWIQRFSSVHACHSWGRSLEDGSRRHGAKTESRRFANLLVLAQNIYTNRRIETARPKHQARKLDEKFIYKGILLLRNIIYTSQQVATNEYRALNTSSRKCSKGKVSIASQTIGHDACLTSKKPINSGLNCYKGDWLNEIHVPFHTSYAVVAGVKYSRSNLWQGS